MPERMREAIGLKRVKALEIEQRVDQAGAGRVAVVDGRKVGPDDRRVFRLPFSDCEKCLADEIRVDVIVIQALGEAMADGVLKPAVIEDVRKHERRQLGLGPRRVLGIVPDAIPHRIVGRNLGGFAPPFHFKHGQTSQT